ncbi:hypothetical protein F5Y17DRAFT_333799 [Xylariaceae sp. FL0594]|nr:hypothetical protein F5Y17DRAFT_333799 [Xylariaceae sp. FL0594]
MDEGGGVGGGQSPLADQYGRENHLTTDSQIDPFALVAKLETALPQPTPDAGPDGLTDDSSLEQLQLPSLHLQEQLEIPRGSVEALGSALRFEVVDAAVQEDTPLARYDARKRIAKLKFELPVLSSDPDEDCRELARAIHEQRQPIISSYLFPPERLSRDLDERIEFPPSVDTFRQAIKMTVTHEKIDVSREGLYQLARALKDDWSKDDHRKLVEDSLGHQTFLHDLAITPPLSPGFEDEECFVPDSKLCEVPFTSSPRSLLSDDMKAAKSTIENEQLVGFPDTATPLLSPLPNKPALEVDRFKLDSIRVESPLLPCSSPHEPSKRGVNVQSLLESMDMDRAFSPSVSGENVDAPATDMSAAHDRDLRNVMEQSATCLMRKLEQECINVEDSTARIQVPVMDFSIPEPEWKSLPMDSKAHLEWLKGKYDFTFPSFPFWPRKTNANAKLRWVPFMRRIDLEVFTTEAFSEEGDDSAICDFIDTQAMPISADYVWKRPGLAVLYESESDEELEAATVTVDAMCDLESLARKRRFQNKMDESDSDCSVDLVLPQKKRPLENTPGSGAVQLTNFLPGADANTAVSTLLSNYINVREAKRQKQGKSSYLSHMQKPKGELFPLSVPEPRSHPSSEQSPKTLEQQAGEIRDIRAPAAPCPEVNALTSATKLIKGLTISRGIFARIEQLYPAAEIIERDFDRWDATAQDPHPSSGETIVPRLAEEADIIVSPITGIILTTLLKTIQRPIPGSGGQSGIRERVRRVSFRYERLVVLVSEGNRIDETARDLTPSEAVAYADFVSFAAGLVTQVMVFYVGGGEATLAKWLVFFADKYSPEAAEIQGHLMQDETQWELFLRRAGFNAYASQAILIRLKAAANDQTNEERDCLGSGLSRFVKMLPCERIKHFRDLIGGEIVLDRINRVLEMKWC